MKDVGYKLKDSQIRWIRSLLFDYSDWLHVMGYGDGEYIRLNDIDRNGRYFDFDKGMLNSIRDSWTKHPPSS